jgi:hypothetical protein
MVILVTFMQADPLWVAIVVVALMLLSAGRQPGHLGTARTTCVPGRVGVPGQAESPVTGARSAVAQGWQQRR